MEQTDTSVENRIIELIDKACIDGRKERDNTKFHPSEIGDCPRKIWYNMNGVKGKDLEPRVIRVFDNGDYLHDRLNKYFESMNVLVKKEIPVTDKVFKGHVDAVLLIDNKLILVDYKSIGSYGFKLMKTGEKVLDERYVAQGTVYMKLLGAKEMYFIFENKDNQDLHIEHLDYDAELFGELLYKAGSIAKAETAPDREESVVARWNGKYCNYCVHQATCLKELNKF